MYLFDTGIRACYLPQTAGINGANCPLLSGVQFGAEGSGLVPWWEDPRLLLLVLPKRSMPKPDRYSEGIIIQQESLGTDMLQELKNSNYARYHIELINRSCGGWLVIVLL